MNEISIFIIAIFIIAAVIIFGIISIYNSIIKNKNAVERAWAGVITEERQKNKILPSIEETAKNYQNYEKDILKEITALRSGMKELSESNIDVSKLEKVENQMSSIMKSLNVMVEAYPNLESAELMRDLMREIVEQQENIGAAIQIFNQNVEIFNNSIQTFPASVINAMLNHEKKITPFYDSKASEGFDYKPNF